MKKGWKDGRIREESGARFAAAGSKEEAYGGSLEIEGFAQAIFQIALVGEMHPLGVVYENDNGRWFNGDLGGVEHFEGWPLQVGGGTSKIAC